MPCTVQQNTTYCTDCENGLKPCFVAQSACSFRIAIHLVQIQRPHLHDTDRPYTAYRYPSTAHETYVSAAVHLIVILLRFCSELLTSAQIFSRQHRSPHVSTDLLTSAQISSRQLRSPHVSSDLLTSAQISSRQLRFPHVSTDLLTSAQISSRQHRSPRVSSDLLTSALISRHHRSPHVNKDLLTSAQISSRQHRSPHVRSDPVQTGLKCVGHNLKVSRRTFVICSVLNSLGYAPIIHFLSPSALNMKLIFVRSTWCYFK